MNPALRNFMKWSIQTQWKVAAGVVAFIAASILMLVVAMLLGLG